MTILSGASLLLLAVGLNPDAAPMDAATFVETMKSLHADIKSVSAIFEGDYRSIDSKGNPRADRDPVLFQGSYALRVEVPLAGLVDIYQTTTPKPPVRTSFALLNNQLVESDRPNGAGLFDPKTRKPKPASGAPGSLRRNHSPENFIFSWYFSNYSRIDPARMRFDCLGYEDVDGHSCLKVDVGTMPGGDSKRSHYVLWIDLLRGGHPLKVEWQVDGNLLSRVDSIEIGRFADVKGKMVWFPTRGETKVFGVPGGKVQDYPIARETNAIVLGSLRLNLDLPDSTFVVHTKATSKTARSIELERTHPVVQKTPVPSRPRTDPAGVQARLDKSLAEAERQAKEIEASSPAREGWAWSGVAQMTFAVIGIILVGSAGVARWRHS